MISGITSADPFLRVSNGESSGVYYNTGNPSAGMVRYNQNKFQVYDGYNWLDVPSNLASIGLSDYAVEAIEWSLKKMKQDKRIEELSKTHPAIKSAYENYKQAEERLQTTIYLSQNE